MRARVIRVLDRLRGAQRVTIDQTQRALLIRAGRIAGILPPGEHVIVAGADTVALHYFDVTAADFVSPYAQDLLREHPELAAAHLETFDIASDEIAVLHRDGRPFRVAMPGSRHLLWRAAGPWRAARIDLGRGAGAEDKLALPRDLADSLTRSGLGAALERFEIAPGTVGLAAINGVEIGVLPPGPHAFWALPGVRIDIKRVDLRRQSLDINGQEMLTRDRVTVRLNLSVDYRVVDPVLVAGQLTDHADTLYRAVQRAYRQAIATRSLDGALDGRQEIDEGAHAAVRAAMAGLGVEIGAVTIKDLILPGEMRDILNKVVAAQKEAEANIIRRREETNATRSLLNTARVMAENPIMLRLKELEALETIAGKVGHLTVHNGTRGLLDDIATLRPSGQAAAGGDGQG